MSSTVTQLADLLGKTRRPGDFYARGKGELLPPSLSVQGVGPIALPLLPTLICTMNQGSYKLKVKQRRQDLKDEASLAT
jgi:hypothetical protein